MATTVKDRIKLFLERAEKNDMIGRKLSRGEVILLLMDIGLYSPSSHEKYIRLLSDLKILIKCHDGSYVINKTILNGRENE